MNVHIPVHLVAYTQSVGPFTTLTRLLAADKVSGDVMVAGHCWTCCC
jgi:hypothetical protein